MQPENMGT
jgi:tetratricopeptide (TPR) repeat protein